MDRSSEPIMVPPHLIRFTQNCVSVSDLISPDVSTLPWRDYPPHTNPLHVIEHTQGGCLFRYVAYDNRRLYSAKTDGVEQNPDLLVSIVVHARDEPLSPMTELAEERVVLTWRTEGCVYKLFLRSVTWFGSITMRAFKQSDVFPITGSDALPTFDHLEPTWDLYHLSGDYFDTYIPESGWTNYLSATPTNTPIMVGKWATMEVFHERSDLRAFLLRYSTHFRATYFRSCPNSVHVRTPSDEAYKWAFGDALMDAAELEDEIEFAWVEEQMKVTPGSVVMVADSLDRTDACEEHRPIAQQSSFSTNTVVHELDAMYTQFATRLILSTNPSLSDAARQLRRHLANNTSGSVTARVSPPHVQAMFESFTARAAVDMAEILREFPLLVKVLTRCILKLADTPTPEEMVVLLVQESSLSRAPQVSPSPPPVPCCVSMSCFQLTNPLPASRCRGLCTAISDAIECQRDWIWGLPVVGVVVRCVTRDDSIHLGKKATRLSASQRNSLLRNMSHHATIARWLHGESLGPLPPSDPAQYLWMFSCRKELHARAEKELLRLLGTQQVDVTKLVDAFVSDGVSRLHG